MLFPIIFGLVTAVAFPYFLFPDNFNDIPLWMQLLYVGFGLVAALISALIGYGIGWLIGLVIPKKWVRTSKDLIGLHGINGIHEDYIVSIHDGTDVTLYYFIFDRTTSGYWPEKMSEDHHVSVKEGERLGGVLEVDVYDFVSPWFSLLAIHKRQVRITFLIPAGSRRNFYFPWANEKLEPA